MPATDRVCIVRETYGAYESGDREMVEKHLAEDFSFYSPADVGIDLATYWERCWPNAEAIATFEFKRIIDCGEEVVVTYEATKADGKRFARPFRLEVQRRGERSQSLVCPVWSARHHLVPPSRTYRGRDQHWLAHRSSPGRCALRLHTQKPLVAGPSPRPSQDRNTAEPDWPRGGTES
jgi:ketosteroid isomerase-like protein